MSSQSSIQQNNPMSSSTRPGKFFKSFNPAAIKQSLEVILSSSVIFKAFCLALLFGYLVTFKENITQYLTVVPGKLLPPNFFLWTLITHSFIEYRIIELITDWFLILLYSKMLEPLWGTLECLQFYFIITSVVAVSTSFFYFIAFAVTFKEFLLFNISVHGLGGLLGGLSVAVKQIMPDTIIVDLSFLRVKQDNLPLLIILISFVVYLLNLTDFTYVLMLTSGVFYGWIYLRFFQKHKNGTRGDSSSTFVFASLFPSQIQPFVAIIANTIFNLLVKLKICKQPPKRYNVSSLVGSNNNSSNNSNNSHVTINIPLIQNTENSDAERRRLKALKALKQRLNQPDGPEDMKTEWSDASSTTNLIEPLSNTINNSSTIQVSQISEKSSSERNDNESNA